jgi:hypothetical protein
LWQFGVIVIGYDRSKSLAGMVWFATAHTLFFVVLAVLYALLRGGHTSRDV